MCVIKRWGGGAASLNKVTKLKATKFKTVLESFFLRRKVATNEQAPASATAVGDGVKV